MFPSGRCSFCEAIERLLAELIIKDTTDPQEKTSLNAFIIARVIFLAA
jgi:hypothetical protein